MRILHAIHDFLPRHRAGSEIYAFRLARALAREHRVSVVCADYDPSREHGSVHWRIYQGLPVAEVINNWAFETFGETYRSPTINRTLDHVLHATQPDVLHVHNLLNLSMDLPGLARKRGIPTVATLHDYTLVCPSGGQRVHVAEQHVCTVIDPDRCGRCFPQSPFHAQMTFARLARRSGASGLVGRTARAIRRRLPRIASVIAGAARQLGPGRISAGDIGARFDAARRVFDDVDLFIAPSAALARDFVEFGIPAGKMVVSDYGFDRLEVTRTTAGDRRLRIGFVGTLAWHKGVHVFIEAVRALPAGTFEVKIFGDLGTFPDYTASLRARARGLPVRFMGRFDDPGAGACYADIDVLVVPSLWPENSPLVIHEAFMAGVPVVGARQGGIPELIRDGENGLLYDAFSVAALTRALRRLIDEPECLRQFAKALPAVKSLDEDAREWDARYRRVASARRP